MRKEALPCLCPCCSLVHHHPPCADPPAGHKKGRLAEDAGGVWSHMLNYGAKLAVMGAAVTLLLEYPEMPGVLQSFCLSEWVGRGGGCVVVSGLCW